MEIPCQEKDDINISKNLYNVGESNNVYFIDGMDTEQAKQCLDALGNFLVKDGMNTFGIGGHESHEEILFGKYNVMTIYTQASEKYHSFFDVFEIKKVDSLVTAWDTFDKTHPGECTIYVSKETGKTVYDIPEMYKEYGIYFYERRSEDDEQLSLLYGI